jgi:hypothetical protein
MNPLERALKLRQEADLVLQEIRLSAILAPYSRIVPTGSYFLDVMVYPDIDVYMSKVSIEQLFQIGAQLAACPRVFQVVFEKSRDAVLMPGGLYLKARVEYGDWGRPWKIDIWSLDEAVIDQRMADMQRFRHKMTDRLREQIVNYKVSILTDQQRTPMYSGYFIYKAFLDEGIADFQKVAQYLKDNGIAME